MLVGMYWLSMVGGWGGEVRGKKLILVMVASWGRELVAIEKNYEL
jgi:hypothetical protein